MTSYCPQARYAGDDDWQRDTRFRFATREEAQASLAHVIATRDDLIGTRIVEIAHGANFKWVVVIDPIDGTATGAAIPRGNRELRDPPKKYRR